MIRDIFKKNGSECAKLKDVIQEGEFLNDRKRTGEISCVRKKFQWTNMERHLCGLLK